MGFLDKLFPGLKGRILASIIPSVIAFVVVGFFASQEINNSQALIDRSVQEITPEILNIEKIIAHRQAVGYYLAGAVATFDRADLRDDYMKKAKKNSDEMLEHIDKYIKGHSNDESSKTTMKDVFTNRAELGKVLEEMHNNLAAKTAEKDGEVRKQLFEGRYRQLSTWVREASEKELDVLIKESESLRSAAAANKSRSMTLILSVVAAAVLTLFVLLFLTATKISRQVGTITNGISKAGSVVTGSIDQLTSAGSTLAQHSTAAAASLEETVASLEEMTSMVQLNSDNAKQASALSQASRDAAEQGEKEIHSLITSMNDISASSKKIEEIINVIDDIAFQTNLLALNAAVEAARAGEQGKGFAVVAEAVRSLAQRSAAAAKDITGLIKDSVQKIDHGTQTADRSGAVLNNIVTSVKKVADLNNEIATASSEQTTGISQISKAMNQLDQTSQNNAASSEEIASSAQNISRETIKMMSSLENLKHMILGGGDFHEEEAAPVKKSASTASSGEGFWSSLFGSKKPAPPKPSVQSMKKPAPKKDAKVLKFEKKATKPAPAAPTSKSTPAAPLKAMSGVVKPRSASDVIPFDEDEPRGKIGSTDGF